MACELAGGNNDTKALFFPMALEPTPLRWFNKLRKDSVYTWEELKALFVENFVAVLTRSTTKTEFRNCKQNQGESLSEYYRRFSEMRATILDVLDSDVIEFFSEGIREH
jgi:hypothetical protein